MNFKIINFLTIFVLFFLSPRQLLFAQQVGTINLTSEGGGNKFAPGEFISFSIKLINFGSLHRGDVTLNYQILDNQNTEVLSSSETVAVETSASFVKRIFLPSTLIPGSYTLTTNLVYPGQQNPAVSKFDFIVENKIIGLFKSDLIKLLIIVGLIFLILLFILYLFIRRIKKSHIVSFDYSDKPKDQLIFYEILANVINQMRLRIGDNALSIASNIPDLEINHKTGKIINIKKEPSKIIALLIYRFEKYSGQKISFSLQPNTK